MSKGFTLIELVLVITILGIIAMSALPSFTNVTTQAERASRDAVEGAVSSGLQIYRANDMTVNGPPGGYPETLDAVPSGTACSSATPCFGAVLISPIGDYKNGRGWAKVADTQYLFNDGVASYTYNYDPAVGTFMQ